MAKFHRHAIPLLTAPFSVPYIFYCLYYLSPLYYGLEISENNVIRQQPYHFFFTSAMALSPFLFYFTRSGESMLREIKEIATGSSLTLNKVFLYIAFISVFVVIYFSVASLDIPTLTFRVRNWVDTPPPYFPYQTETPYPGNLMWMLSWFIPWQFSPATVQLLGFGTIFLYFLCNNKRQSSFVPVAIFSVSFFHLYLMSLSSLAAFELTTSIFGTLGILAIINRNFAIGFLALTLASVFRHSGPIFAVIGGAVYLFHVANKRASLRQFWPLILVCAILSAAHQLFLLNRIVTVTKGLGYMTDAVGTDHTVPLYFVTAFGFIRELATNYPIVFTLAFVFMIWGLATRDRQAMKLMFVFISLMALRAVFQMYTSYYNMFFYPVLMIMAFQMICLSYDFVSTRVRRPGLLLYPILLVGVAGQVVFSYGLWDNARITRHNSNFDQAMARLAETLPKHAVIFQSEVSLAPYLRDLGRHDVEFRYYSENKNEVLSMLGKEGCRVFVAPEDELGITNQELFSIGYKDTYGLRSTARPWRLFSKDCA